MDWTGFDCGANIRLGTLAVFLDVFLVNSGHNEDVVYGCILESGLPPLAGEKIDPTTIHFL